MQRYTEAVSKRFSGRKLLPTFVKTGDQSRYDDIEKAGYKLFLRSDFLAVLREGRELGVSNAIFADFLETLEELDTKVRSWRHLPVPEWPDDRESSPWIGFYEYLQSQKKDLEWHYVPNQTGGFLSALWHRLNWQGCEVYLQIAQGPLCFKICVEEESKRAEIRDRWHDKLMETAKRVGALSLKRPGRFGHGNKMRAAIIDRHNWMMAMPDGRIDLATTMQRLEVAEQLLEAAVE